MAISEGLPQAALSRPVLTVLEALGRLRFGSEGRLLWTQEERLWQPRA